VREAAGFAIGGVFPVGHPVFPPDAIDGSLSPFGTAYLAAGHGQCVFATTADEWQGLIGSTLSESIGLA